MKNTIALSTTIQAVVERLNAAKKTAAHMMLAGHSRKDIWARATGGVIKHAKAVYQAHSRMVVAQQITNAMETGAPMVLAPLAREHKSVADAIDSVFGAYGQTESDDYKLPFVNLPLRGLDGKIDWTNIPGATSLTKMLSSMDESEISGLLRMLVKGQLKDWASDISSRVNAAMHSLKLYSFDYEDGVTYESAYPMLLEKAFKRANGAAPKPSAYELMTGVTTDVWKIAGGIKAISCMVVKEYALKEYVMRNVREQARLRAENSYVRHTAGGSYLVESKDGDRPGSASGRDTAKDVDALRESVSESNFDELDSFITELMDIYKPAEEWLGVLPACVVDDITYPATELRKAFEARVHAWMMYFRTQEAKGEGYQDRKHAAILDSAAKMDAMRAETFESRVEELLRA